jgi:hypothetical protein
MSANSPAVSTPENLQLPRPLYTYTTSASVSRQRKPAVRSVSTVPLLRKQMTLSDFLNWSNATWYIAGSGDDSPASQ